MLIMQKFNEFLKIFEKTEQEVIENVTIPKPLYKNK